MADTLSKTVSAPLVDTTAKNRLYSYIQRTQTPLTVESVLNNALNGYLWEQHLVFVAMVDTWPRLAKALEEVSRESSKAPFEVVPFAKRGKKPTARATSKAQYIEDILCCVKPDPFRAELGWKSLHSNLAQGFFYGHHVVETLWQQVEGSQRPRAFKYVSPEFYRYPTNIAEEDRLMLNLSGQMNGNLIDFPAYHFLVGINKAHLGHASIAAPLRGLVQYWIAANFGLKWFMQFAQNFGVPLRWATYPASDQQAQHDVACMLQSIGSNGWGAFPSGTNVEILEASKSAQDLPQALLIDLADRQVDIRILGQSLTTDVGDSGSRALGDVHGTVRRGVIVGVADWVASIIGNQLIPDMIALKFGAGHEHDEMPTYEVQWEEHKDAKLQAEVSQILFKDMKLPVSTDWLYETHGVPRPEPGDELFDVPEPPAPLALPGDPNADPDADPKDKKADPKTAKKEDDEEPNVAKAALKPTPGRVLDRPIVDQLTDTVLEDVSGVAADFLRGVRPFFRSLVTAALDRKVSDAEFIATLESASNRFPELFESLDIETLSQKLENAIGTSMLSGARERLL
jgi:phage gp29-like protein